MNEDGFQCQFFVYAFLSCKSRQETNQKQLMRFCIHCDFAGLRIDLLLNSIWLLHQNCDILNSSVTFTTLKRKIESRCVFKATVKVNKLRKEKNLQASFSMFKLFIKIVKSEAFSSCFLFPSPSSTERNRAMYWVLAIDVWTCYTVKCSQCIKIHPQHRNSR